MAALGSGLPRLEQPKWCQTLGVNNLMNVRIDIRDESVLCISCLAPGRTHGGDSRDSDFKLTSLGQLGLAIL